MIRRLLFFIGLTFVSFVMSAQEQNESKKSLYVLYIAHDAATPVEKLCEQLKQLCKDNRRHHHPTLIYLSNDESPFCIRLNMNKSGVTEEELYGELKYHLSHHVNAAFDYKYLCKELENIVITDGKERTYEDIDFRFYITPEFTGLNYQEELISLLFWRYNLKDIKTSSVNFNVFFSDGDEPLPTSRTFFGAHNWDNISDHIVLQKY